MAQTWTAAPVPSTTVAATQLVTNIPNNFDCVRSWFYGAVEPTDRIAGMVWADSATGLIKMRDSGNTQWYVLGPIPNGTVTSGQLLLCQGVGALATKNVNLGATKKGTVAKLVLVPDTTTVTSTGAKEWTFQLRNITQALNLFSGTVGTGTALGGVGGGAELTINAAFVLTPNQNANTNENDVLQLQIAQVGAPTAVTDVRAQVDYYQRG